MEITPRESSLEGRMAAGEKKRVQQREGKAASQQSYAQEKWSIKKGVGEQNAQIQETFGVSEVFKKIEYVDPVKESGNKANEAGIIHNLTLGRDTGAAPTQGSKFVGNNNMLETWKDATSSEPRRLVMDYSKTPQEQKAEKLKPSNSIDLEG